MVHFSELLRIVFAALWWMVLFIYETFVVRIKGKSQGFVGRFEQNKVLGAKIKAS